jgi:hypothetical protein
MIYLKKSLEKFFHLKEDPLCQVSRAEGRIFLFLGPLPLMLKFSQQQPALEVSNSLT